MPDRDPDVRIAIQHSIRILSRWTIALYVAVALIAGIGVLSNRATVNTNQANIARIDTALCAFVGDLERRADSTAEYLKKHPGKEPIPGISRADLRRSLENQRRTLDSLKGLKC